MTEKEHLYTISDFAELWGITRQTLIYYDNIGLLKPTIKDPDSGYRFYNLEHYNQLSLIFYLQQLGLTLSQIISYKRHLSLETLYYLLNKQKQALQHAIIEGTSGIEAIDDTLNNIDCTNLIGHILVEFRPEIHLKLIPFTSDTHLKQRHKATIDLAYYTHLHTCRNTVSPYIYSGGAIVSGQLTNSLLQSVTGFFFRLPHSKKQLANQTFPPGRYLTLCFTGAWESALPYYHELIQYASLHGLELAGDFLEEFIGFQGPLNNAQDYVYKLAIRIKTAGP